MYPSTIIGIRGYRCPISGKTFHCSGDSRTERHQAYREQQAHTAEVLFDLENQFGHKLSIEEYRRLYLLSN